ncbi:MAG: hypothetical protein WKF37_17685 [Bryobacteraceae bacterium]
MSRYSTQPLDFAGLKTVSIHDRGGKVRTEHFARPYRRGDGVSGLLDSLPHLLAADGLRQVAAAMAKARAGNRQIIWGFGGHVIKCGLAPVLLNLMERGFATAFAMNGSGAIHDFEIAIAGHTAKTLKRCCRTGAFGSAEETGREMNVSIAEGDAAGLGIGEALGKTLDRIALPAFREQSLVYSAYQASVPVTVHVAIGTDTPHTHPAAVASAIGSATHCDFRLFCGLVSGLDEGGVYLNVGSAVIMPEVFLKAVSSVRNLGYPLANFTTVNFDFVQHYRPKLNVVERPHVQAGGKGYALTGHHEIMIPLLAAILLESEK